MSSSYWEQRFERLKAEQMRKAEASVVDLQSTYAYTLQQLRKEVVGWYQQYAKENPMTLADARKQLDARELKVFKMTLKEYIKMADQAGLPAEHIAMLKQASIRARLDRSQALYVQMSQYIESLAAKQNINLTDLLKDVYADSYYKTAYETQRMQGDFSTFKRVPQGAIDATIAKPWASDGKDFSSRIWDDKQRLTSTLQSEITQSLMIGEGTTLLADRVSKRMNVSFSNARRLVETETAYVQEKAAFDTYDRLGVEQYQILATLDSKTTQICRHLDKKVFDKKDAKVGITTPPFHCYCRTTTIPYIKGITNGDDGDTRAARDPQTGKTVDVDGDLNYEGWYNKYVKGYEEPTGRGGHRRRKEVFKWTKMS